MRFAALMMLALMATCPLSASAQYVGYRPGGAYGNTYNYAGGTVAGSAAAGMGALIEAQGAYNQMTAQAMVPYEQAKSLALDNKLKSAQTYYELQRLNRENKAAEEARVAAMYKKAPPTKTPRLSPTQLDPVTGQINWPPIFLDASYQPERGKLDELYAQRAQQPSEGYYAQARTLAFAMRDKLDKVITSLPTNEFFSYRHFLESLAEEARHTGYETASATPTPTKAQ